MRVARRPGLTNAGAVVIVIFILAAAYIYLASTGQAPALNVQGQHTTGATSTSSSLPLTVSVTDKYGNYADTGDGTITVYQNGAVVGGPTGLSDNTVIFSNVFVTPGEVFSILFTQSDQSSLAEWFPNVVVPSSSSLIQSTQTYAIPIVTFTLGTYSIAMSDQSNNAYTGGGCFNETAGTGHQCGGGSATASKPGVNPSNLFLTVANSATNTGYTSTFDPVDNLQLSSLLVISGAGAASFSGCGQTFTRSGTFYCVTALVDAQLSCQKIGQSLTCASSRTSITVAPGTISHGSSETETITMYVDANANNFQSIGSWGPYAQTAATTTLKIGV